MNAHKFVAEKGIDEAKRVLSKIPLRVGCAMDNFEDALNQHKEGARKIYAESGEGNLVNGVLRDIESNCADYEYYFQKGQQSKQKQIDELKSTIEKQKNLSLKAIDNAKAGSSLELQLAQKLHAESQPDLIESERAMNAQLTNENLLLESKVSELQALVDAALQEIKGAARWIDEDAIDDPEFIKGGALRALKRLEQALKGGEDQYQETRKAVEDRIDNGAKLTNHRIDL